MNHPHTDSVINCSPLPRKNVLGLTAAVLSLCALLPPAPAVALGLNCSVSSTGVAFGAYNPTNGSPTDATGNVHVVCTVLLASVLAQTNISLGTGGSGAYSPRKMSSGTHRLDYNLYQEASHTTVWGDGTGGTAVMTDNVLIAVLGTSIDHTIYGRIPPNQFTAAGSYSDTITVTVEFHEAL